MSAGDCGGDGIGRGGDGIGRGGDGNGRGSDGIGREAGSIGSGANEVGPGFVTGPGRGRPATRAVRAGLESDTQHGAVVPPLHLSSNFTFEGPGRPRRYDYTRSGNPTRDLLGEALAELEGGASAVVTASGMAAVTTVLQLAGPQDRVVAPRDAYGGTHRLLRALEVRGAFRLTLLDLWDPAEVARLPELGPSLVWVETPSNPLLRVTDLASVAAATRTGGGLVVVDNTLLSPALQRPIEHGADIVVHSTTKYLNGHSDVVGGAVVAADRAVGEELAWWANCLGVTGAPFDAWLTLRGVRTLHSRVRLQQANAERLVANLQGHPAVERLWWPGLPDHPGHAVAARQQDGFGAMISFEVASADALHRVLTGLRHFSLAESLGGVESLIAHPATMTHASMDAAARAEAGIDDRLVRLSVGIEDGDDLVEDLVGALDRCVAGPVSVALAEGATAEAEGATADARRAEATAGGRRVEARRAEAVADARRAEATADAAMAEAASS